LGRKLSYSEFLPYTDIVILQPVQTLYFGNGGAVALRYGAKGIALAHRYGTTALA
jgi:hypothetical protein